MQIDLQALAAARNAEPEKQKPAVEDDLARFARIAYIIGVSTSIAITGLMVLAAVWFLAWFTAHWRVGAGIYVSLLVLAWIGAALCSAWWTWHFRVRRPEKLENEDRAARQPQTQVKVIEQVNQLDLEKGQLLCLYGWKALAFELLEEKPADIPHLTREYAEKALGISQRAYRKLNCVFVEMGWKTEATWLDHADVYPLLEYARLLWDVDGGGVWLGTRHLIFPKDWDK